MIKIIFRVVIILLVAILLSAGLFALVQNGSSRIELNARSQFNPSANAAASARPEVFRGEERNFRGAASLARGLGGILVTLLQIGAITFIVLQFQKALKTPRSTS
jgi:hypothetical protein